MPGMVPRIHFRLQHTLHRSLFAVLSFLAEYHDRYHGNCYPGIATIARRTDYCERQVRRILRQLVVCQLLDIAYQASPLRTNVYRLKNIPELVPKIHKRGGHFYRPSADQRHREKKDGRINWKKSQERVESWSPQEIEAYTTLYQQQILYTKGPLYAAP